MAYSRSYDLEKRFLDLALLVIRLCKKIPITVINRRIIDQVIGSSGSIAANYNEASVGGTSKEFLHKLRISYKEAKETYNWLILLSESNPEIKTEVEPIFQELQECTSILGKSISTVTKRINETK
ncbi:MAG: four helix bundle protein [Candidatus Roizmanbacteria bacterium]